MTQSPTYKLSGVEQGNATGGLPKQDGGQRSSLPSAHPRESKNRRRRWRVAPWLIACLIGIPLLFMVAKLSFLPTAEFLHSHLSLTGLPPRLQRKLGHILFLPLGALLVVFFRLTLGLRVLGPFRSILLAVSFQITGIVLGLIFLVSTISIVVFIRRFIRMLHMPYFGRITVMLSTVAALMVLGVLAGDWLHLSFLRMIAFFPIVVLCLVADAFARTVNMEGFRSAFYRGTITALLAVLLTAMVRIPHFHQFLLVFPEALIAQIGCIILIAKFLAFRWLQHLNPKVGDDEEDLYELYDRAEVLGVSRRALSGGAKKSRPSASSGPSPAVEVALAPTE
jgi:hypothetical protein